MKALVTGSTGFIGSHITDKLLKKGFQIRCLIRKGSNTRWIPKHKNIEIYEGDFFNSESLKSAVEDVNYVFHSAGLNFSKNKNDYHIVNTLGTKALAESVVKYSSNFERFVYIGSLTASGPSSSLTNPKTEDMERNPVTAYGLSKKNAEDEIIKLTGKLPFTIIKPPAVYGPRDTAIFEIIRMMHYGFAVHIGFNDKYISVIFVEDLANAVTDIINYEKTLNQSYFIADDNYYNWNYISDVFKKVMNKSFYIKLKVPDSLTKGIGKSLENIYAIFGKHPKFDYDKGLDFTQQYWTCSVEKAKNDFGFRTRYSFEESMKITYEWYKQNKWI